MTNKILRFVGGVLFSVSWLAVALKPVLTVLRIKAPFEIVMIVIVFQLCVVGFGYSVLRRLLRYGWKLK